MKRRRFFKQKSYISPAEASRDWNLWKPASQDEVDSLLFEKRGIEEDRLEDLQGH